MRRARAVAALAPALLIGCGDGPPSSGEAHGGAPWFREVAAEWGLAFRHVSGQLPDRYLMPEIMGGGVALLDADGDGRLDVYFVQSGVLGGAEPAAGENRLFLNRGPGPDGAPRFDDVTAGSGAAERGYGMGVACGDYDGDGDTDLYVTNWGANALLRNEGGGRFHDVTDEAGVGHPGWGTSAAFLDYDGDGRLDLYVANYLEWSIEGEIDCRNQMGEPDYCNPANYSSPALDALFHNEGDGTFRDVSRESGVASEPGTGLGVGCADFDGDGLLDVFVANDGLPDFLWRNLGEGRFENVARTAGCALDRTGVSKAGMGVAIADIDADGDEDLLVCNLRDESDSLFQNEGGVFTDRTLLAGLGTTSRGFTRFGLGWVDFDRDGLLDLYQASGRVERRGRGWSADVYAEPNLVFRGLADLRYEELLPRGGTDPLLIATSRAAAFGDLDGDGGVDVVVCNRDAPAHVLHDVAPPAGRWIGLRLVDERGADALHARVSLRAGDRRVQREVRAAFSYQASSDPRVVVGLGAARTAEEVEVRWPDGQRERFGALEAGCYHVLGRGRGL